MVIFLQIHNDREKLARGLPQEGRGVLAECLNTDPHVLEERKTQTRYSWILECVSPIA